MKARVKIASLMSLLFFGGGLGVACGQIGFASSQLERLAYQTNLAIPTKDSVYYQTEYYKDCPVTIIVNNGEVSHIGLSLFTTFQRQFFDEKICNFLERMALAAEIPDFYGIAFSQYLRDEKIEMLEGNWKDLKSIMTDTSYIFQSTLVDGKNYINCWYTPDAHERFITLTYPADYHLISGYSMTESEDRLYDDICCTRIQDTMCFEPDSTLLQRIGNSLVYLFRGDIYFLPELNSNRYYVADTLGKFGLLYSEDFPLESLANLVTGIEIENSFVINVKLVKYGFLVDEFTAPLTTWLSYCIQSGCTLYFGVISQKEKEIICEFIAQNEAFGYCHVMKFTIDPSLIESREGSMQARLNSYVPMSNVKALFSENN